MIDRPILEVPAVASICLGKGLSSSTGGIRECAFQNIELNVKGQEQSSESLSNFLITTLQEYFEATMLCTGFNTSGWKPDVVEKFRKLELSN